MTSHWLTFDSDRDLAPNVMTLQCLRWRDKTDIMNLFTMMMSALLNIGLSA